MTCTCVNCYNEGSRGLSGLVRRREVGLSQATAGLCGFVETAILV